MKASDIFVKSDAEIGLGAFSRKASEVLRIDELRERESSNYANGVYYAGTLDGSKVQLYLMDTEGPEQYRFAITIDPCNEARVSAAASALAESGFLCFVPLGTWYKSSWDGEGTSYGF